MTDTPNQHTELLLAMIQEVVQPLAANAVSIESHRTKNDDGTLIWLRPSNPRAAVFSAHIEDGHPSLMDVSFGSVTTLELPWEAKLPNNASFEDVLGAVREIIVAVVSGHCEERFGFLGIRGKVRIDDGKVYRCTHFFYPRLFPKTVHYERY